MIKKIIWSWLSLVNLIRYYISFVSHWLTFLCSREHQLSLVLNMLLQLSFVWPANCLLSQSCEHLCLVISINDFLEFIPNEPETRLSVPAASAEKLDVRSRARYSAHDEQRYAFRVRMLREPIVHPSSQFRVRDEKHVFSGQLSETIYIPAVCACYTRCWKRLISAEY